MAVTALVVWILTACGGALMAASWVRAGGARSTVPEPTDPVPVPGTPAGLPDGALPADYTTAINPADPIDPAGLAAAVRRPVATAAEARASSAVAAATADPGVNPAGTRLTPALVFGHAGLAAAGLVVWLAYVLSSARPLAWLALVLLLVVIGAGEVMFLRWFGARAGAEPVIESRFPKALVYGHGLGAMTTVVLVLLAALGVGS